jgi:antitoxin MazE
LALRIPKVHAEAAALKEGSEVEITVNEGRLVVTPLRRHYRLADLVRGITRNNRHDPVDWGRPRGREAW